MAKAAETAELELTDDQVAEMSTTEKAHEKQLREVQTWDDALALSAEIHGDVQDITEKLGTGFNLLKDKDRLVGKPFVVISFGFNEGDFDGYFTSLAVVTKDEKKYIVNDGSTGIRDQLMELARETRRFGGWLVPHGLRKSEYNYEDKETGKITPATTYYLDTSTDE